MPQLPTGTVTFLFTDIEGSTNLARALGDRWTAILDEHHTILRRAIRGQRGLDLQTEGDAFFAVFPSAVDAVKAAAEAQRSLAGHDWPSANPVRVRMGMHTGEGRLGGDEYVGLDVHRAARVAAAGHGGQILISEATRALVADKLPDGLALLDLGEHRLKDFDDPQRIHQLAVEGLPQEFEPLRTLDVPMNLPTPPTTFVGRQREVEEISELLNTARLVTLTGPGGTGKTRLALEVAARALPRFGDGVFFVDLSPITDPTLVASATAQVLGVKERPDRPALGAVTEYLANKTPLLVLDNFEQVLPGAATVDGLLAGAPGLRVLCTSREVLHLYGEREFPVPPLEVPDPARTPDVPAVLRYESVVLFIDRARAVRPEFSLTEGNAQAVAEICARLDGLPLAIELAASRVKLLTPRDILERLDRRLHLLATAAPNLPERQRTLRGAIAWSYELLAEPERRSFARLSVFSGGWTLKAAEAVVNPSSELGIDTLDWHASLVDKSLLRHVESADEETRLTMLETIREYAAERLREGSEEAAIRRRHAEHFLMLVEEAEPHLVAEDQAIWLDRCEREHDNIRAALRWAVESGEGQIALRIGAAVWRFWYQRGHLREGAGWLNEALGVPGPRDAARANGHTAAGGLEYWRNDYEATRRHYEEAQSIWRELGDRRGEMESLYNLAFVPLASGDPADAIPLWERSLALARDLDDPAMAARSRGNIGFARIMLGQPAAALPLLEEANATWKVLGNRFELGDNSHALGQAHRMAGNLEQAAQHYREGIRIFHQAGNLSMIAAGLDPLAAIASAEGRHVQAVRLSAAASAIKAAIGGGAPPAALMVEDVLPPARDAIGDEAVDAALTEGRAMTLEQAVAYALEDEP